MRPPISAAGALKPLSGKRKQEGGILGSGYPGQGKGDKGGMASAVEKNYLLPFFWQHGEAQGTLEEYMERIRECGCEGVCVEARPHPEFGKDRWWEDVGFIVDKAKKDGMEVWILDDSHFPTGFANGLVKEKYPQFLKTYLDLRRFDVAGTSPHCPQSDTVTFKPPPPPPPC